MFLGGVLVAGSLTAVGALIGVAAPMGVRIAAVAALLGALAVFEIAGRSNMLPQNRRLVPQTILAANSIAGPLQFGFEMGTGLRTFAPSALPLATVAMALLWAPNAIEGLALAVGFGLGRTLAIPARRGDPERWDHRMSVAKGPVRLILAAAFAIVVARLLQY